MYKKIADEVYFDNPFTVNIQDLAKTIKYEYTKQQNEMLLALNKPILLYRFMGIRELDNFLWKHDLKDFDVQIIITRKELSEIRNLKFEDGENLFEINIEKGVNTYRGFELMVL